MSHALEVEGCNHHSGWTVRTRVSSGLLAHLPVKQIVLIRRVAPSARAAFAARHEVAVLHHHMRSKELAEKVMAGQAERLQERQGLGR